MADAPSACFGLPGRTGPDQCRCDRLRALGPPLLAGGGSTDFAELFEAMNWSLPELGRQPSGGRYPTQGAAARRGAPRPSPPAVTTPLPGPSCLSASLRWDI